MRQIVIGAFVAALAAAGVLAQAPQPLSAIERLRIENLSLKQQLIEAKAEIGRWQGAFGECAAARAAYEHGQNAGALEAELATQKRALDAVRPGYSWDWSLGRFEPVPPGGGR
ncbi:MAG: hypothetical protein AB7O67_23235 [Vicinamibacterales bacterium]